MAGERIVSIYKASLNIVYGIEVDNSEQTKIPQIKS